MAINMHYCRYENTFKALRECDELLRLDSGYDDLSEDEQKYFLLLVKQCKRISEWIDLEDYED